MINRICAFSKTTEKSIMADLLLKSHPRFQVNYVNFNTRFASGNQNRVNKYYRKGVIRVFL